MSSAEAERWALSSSYRQQSEAITGTRASQTGWPPLLVHATGRFEGIVRYVVGEAVVVGLFHRLFAHVLLRKGRLSEGNGHDTRPRRQRKQSVRCSAAATGSNN